ncbi:MAG: GNAT family N-acetyltransferase [Solirubrobacterales bacterium]
MASGKTQSGVEYDPRALDLVERRFWRGIWESVPPQTATERGIQLRRFGPIQATIVTALPQLGMLNLLLGATEPGAIAGGHLAAAAEWSESLGVAPYVPVSPGLPETAAAEAWLAENGFESEYAWMKFVRDTHPPRFVVPDDVEVVELSDSEREPFGMLATSGFGLPAWASTFFARLPERGEWRCYVARVDGIAQACAAMLVHEDVAEFGIAATLETARGRGCQRALLGRRILDAAEAGCRTLFVETGARVPGRPAASYRNILRAGFEEAYLRPNWQRRLG